MDSIAVITWLKDLLMAWGLPGLFLVSIGDSTFLSLPEVNDIMVMMLSIETPGAAWKFALLAASGSTLGCVVLYTIGRKGGEALLRRRFKSAGLERARRWYQQYGALAVMIPALAPPPMPFKLCVFSAGAFGFPLRRFVIAIAVARFARYFMGGLLAIRYGPAIVNVIREDFRQVVLAIVTLAIAAAIGFAALRFRFSSARPLGKPPEPET
ncbi:MAG TPA: VTT domain-containing protein [Terriglobia bacterium]|nr:VTT domain-containing protein [Terriglobia bacterium]